MRLIIGGRAQGKLEYVLLNYDVQESVVYDGTLPNDSDDTGSKTVVINHFHQWVRNRILNGGAPESEIQSYVDNNENCIIICDEIGNGIVPIEPFEREYRERVGRILVQLAKRAEGVERVICGIGQKIK
ncbi:MAG: bifunctional adenosylcobinamide kinase/adenosylcobinamide-phosphate guanylyltransferase [Clostridiales bacterium]|nr:bifunctional adenosylcobinamide kinase/adenosylcobinamide-phosphate guanylyltransferase [Clostridiales bacterium]